MIKSFSVKNFRGFEDLSIDSFKRVNLILGQNNTGKTALLEALVILLGVNNPGLTLAFNNNRGLKKLALDPEAIWGWLFYNHISKNTIKLIGKDEHEIKHTLEIELNAKGFKEINADKSRDVSMEQQTALSEKMLNLHYANSKDENYKIRAWMVQGGLQYDVIKRLFPGSFYLPNNAPLEDNVGKFSKLQSSNKDEEIVDILKIIEPRIKRLVVSYINGVATIECDLGIVPLIPIAYMGDGINKLLSILLSIASAEKGGCVLIDEIENGLHYSILFKVWQTIGELAEKLDVQVFATTHSLECTSAAHQAYLEKPNYDFSLYRLQRSDGKINIVSYDKETLTTSLELGWEIR